MSDISPTLRIGTRGSPLALAQANEVRNRLIAAHPALTDAVEIRIIKTTGDSVTDRTLAAIGGKGLFTKEIEEALLDGAIDLAVHSMKDVPTVLPDGLVIDCLLPREDPRDAFFSPLADSIDTLPRGATVGTASLRRQAQLLHRRPDLNVVPFRGNVQTRLTKLQDGVVQATLLAIAGMNRLGMAGRETAIIPTETLLPAVAQGAVGIERRAADERVAGYLAPLDHELTAIRVRAERALLTVLDGTCRTPIAALAEFDGGDLRLRGIVARPDGSVLLSTERRGAPADAERLGRDAGLELRQRAGDGFFHLTLPDLPAV